MTVDEVDQLEQGLARAVADRLDECRQLRAWLLATLPSTLRERLEQDLRVAEAAAVSALLGCQDLGGEVTLALPGPPGVADQSPPTQSTDQTEADLGAEPEEDAESSPEPEPAPQPGAGELVASTPHTADPEAASSDVDAGPDGPHAAAPATVPTTSPEAPAKARPANAALLETLLKAGLQKGTHAAQAPVVSGTDDVRRAVAAAVDLPGRPGVDALLATLPSWISFAATDQVLLVEIGAAKLRAAQAAGLDIDEDFKRLARFFKQTMPGKAHGLALAHAPRKGTWAADAKELAARLAPAPSPLNAERELAALKREFVSYLDAANLGDEEAADAKKRTWAARLHALFNLSVRRDDPRLVTLFRDHSFVLDDKAFAKLRRAIRDADDADEPEVDRNALAADWPLFHHTRGKRALMIGGDPREPHRTRVHTAFQFADLDWLPTEFSRNPTQQAKARIEAGAVDLVLPLHRWCPHKVDETLQPACKAKGVPYVSVQNSYGVTGLRLAFERFLKP